MLAPLPLGELAAPPRGKPGSATGYHYCHHGEILLYLIQYTYWIYIRNLHFLHFCP